MFNHESYNNSFHGLTTRGYSHVEAYRDVPPKWVGVFFQQESLDLGPTLSKKSLDKGPD